MAAFGLITLRTSKLDHKGAAAAAYLAAEIAERGSTQDPHSWSFLVANAYLTIGHVLDAEAPSAAFEFYDKALRMGERHIVESPKELQWWGLVTDAHEDSATTSADGGDFQGAIAAYHKSVEGRKRIVEIDPSDQEAQRDLAKTYVKLSYTYELANDFSNSLAALREGLAVSQSGQAKDPSEGRWLLYQANFQRWIGDAYKATGNMQDALSAYRKSRAIAQRIMDTTPPTSRAAGGATDLIPEVDALIVGLEQSQQGSTSKDIKPD
jgi:tetratricopeptide (TPR) repeat protein